MDLVKSKAFQEMMLKYDFAKKKLETEVGILLQEYSFNTGYNLVEHIKTRTKTMDRICQKLERKGYELSVENISRYVNDVIGMRIVCSFISDVYTIVNILKSSGEFIVKSEKDYIKNPKETGYSSFHMMVLVPIHLENRTEYIEAEIQIRTIAMDCWASLDHKLRYKLPEKVSDDLKKEIIDSANDMLKIDLKMQRIADVVRRIEG